MTGRLMRENSFTFPISHKLMFQTNSKPALDHLDDAIRGRLHLIPFDRDLGPGRGTRSMTRRCR